MKILFYPQYPDKEYYSITHIINSMHYHVTRDLTSHFDIAFLWQDSTQLSCPVDLVNTCRHQTIINQHCIDISKVKVELLHIDVFGYGCFVDPLTHQGLCVEKPNDNGVKGGHVISTPITRKHKDNVYQALIDSTIDEYQQEFRVPIIFGEIPIVYLIRQVPATQKLDNRAQLPPKLIATNTVFSAQEQQNILKFCRLIGLDFGELDIVRCRHSQRLYILDANKTPAGYGMLNYFLWQSQDKKAALATLSVTFDGAVKKLINNQPAPRSAFLESPTHE
ncbi:hypothetical protein PSECIP111951_03779 [Pseudoalteromonas holothuriae]|uniref:ATP-grasp domain-containing protein n=1 Tax=Pseudoalteromonas holothuriae TaxID=2963714 RepID=A0ABM9GMS3_9GAMM|nr:hypothetical protein [Pseudoalteromonas sp. CIP111951]CAH9067378.1 hypothetical protein PSECIP111951_03779 [Pseudoalteromonas sp. CIP111951]